MIFALCTYTALIVTINFVTDDETNLFLPGFDVNSLTDQERAERRTGSKLVLVVEQNQILTGNQVPDLRRRSAQCSDRSVVWAVKACLLIMYYRLT